MNPADQPTFKQRARRIARTEIEARRERGLPVRPDLLERRTWRALITEFLPEVADAILHELSQPSPSGVRVS